MIAEEWSSRTELLIGSDNLQKLKNAHLLIVGLGGVGAYAAEQLCRAGIGKFTIVDADTVQPSNRNRQLPALISNQGKLKAKVMAERMRDINPDVNIEVIAEYVKEQRLVDILEAAKYDYVVDAIDTLSPKIYFIYNTVSRGLKLVSSMGAGGKFDPMQVHIADIEQTYMCPLADMIRKRLHKFGLYTGFKAVFSTEKALKDSIIPNDTDRNKKSTVGTISYLPPLFGCCIASVVIREILGHEIKSDLPVPRSIKKKIKETANQ